MVTDGCMWELNNKAGTEHAHAIEVVDVQTGAIRYIRSGSVIKFVDGEITDIRTQKAYNKAQNKALSRNGKGMPERKGRKGQGADVEQPISTDESV